LFEKSPGEEKGKRQEGGEADWKGEAKPNAKRETRTTTVEPGMGIEGASGTWRKAESASKKENNAYTGLKSRNPPIRADTMG